MSTVTILGKMLAEVRPALAKVTRVLENVVVVGYQTWIQGLQVTMRVAKVADQIERSWETKDLN